MKNTTFTEEQMEALRKARGFLCDLVEIPEKMVCPATEEFQRIMDLIAEIERLMGVI